QDFIIVTAAGKALRFSEEEVRAMGRTAAGVMAIDLRDGDTVAAFDVVEPNGDLLIITRNGYGKRTPLAEYPRHSRNTGGQWTLDHRQLDKTGRIVTARVVQARDQVTIITANGIALRTPVAAISQMGRMTRGVRIVNPDNGDTVAAVARLAAAVEEATDKNGEPKTPSGARIAAGPAAESGAGDDGLEPAEEELAVK
ncbi:MAG: DNA gyrase C-terminal beta-propeller domain-containing protein, partial [Anaerolineae bacterium]